MKPSDMITSNNPAALLAQIVTALHADGPVDQELLEALAYIKKFHPKVLFGHEGTLMYLLGLFYKTTDPSDLLSYAYRIFHESIRTEFGATLTPVQSSIQKQIVGLKYFSFSAPTSTGKSHILRSIILEIAEDIVIVLPSRALISEYLIAVRKIVQGHKEVLVLQFVDDVNRANTRKRIFIITPERGSDLFRFKEHLNIGLFIFDEAQISEEGIRGLTFDAFVRRADKSFPNARKVFVHPFVENPEAQLKKHAFIDRAGSQVYTQNAVGKIFVEIGKEGSGAYLFSPFIKRAHLKKNKYFLSYDIVKEVLAAGGSILIYVTKQFIYEGRYRDKFADYIKQCPVVTDPEAIAIINEVERLIGAAGHDSELVRLLRRGIVIHHGSIPLVVRYLLESFANRHFARMCFATSTLAQGVNVPFDLVWIDNLRFYGTDENQTLGLKNLIGRAGRTSSMKDIFDYGYVVVSNSKTFISRFIGQTALNDTSILDQATGAYDENVVEFVTAVKDETIDDIYSLPAAKVSRLSGEEAGTIVAQLIDALYRGDSLITGDDYQALSVTEKQGLKRLFGRLFEIAINRPLDSGEQGVLSTALGILLWQIQGRSFRTLIGLRNSYLTRRTEQREIHRRYRRGQITVSEREAELASLEVKYSPVAVQLPHKGAPKTNRFAGITVKKMNYDLVVYDTYDYIDKVISFSLSDIYVSAFDKYYISTKDKRARAFADFMRYGTDDPDTILLIRYGFSPENVDSIAPHVKSISEDRIVFRSTVNQIDDEFDAYLVAHYS